MYYEEKVIDGRLCWRGLPNGGWTPFKASELTVKLMKAHETIDNARVTMNRMDLGQLDEIDCLRELDVILVR